MNKQAQGVRVWATNDIIKRLVAVGYEFFSAVYLHSDYNAVGTRHQVSSKLEIWSDSLFFTVPGKALILRVSLSYQGAANSPIAATSRDRMIISFRLIAAPKPLEWLNKIAQEQHVALRTIPLDDCAFDHFSQPLIPVFVVNDAPQGFTVRDRMNWFLDSEDKWVVARQGSWGAVLVHQLESQVVDAVAKWLAPALPYVKDGVLDIPERSGLTEDRNFLKSESLMRERLNMRSLKEIANFGKFL
jgi:hypothetical protein